MRRRAEPEAAAISTAIARPPPHRAWAILALLACAYAIAFLDRVVLSLLVDAIKGDLQITDAQIGLLQGFAFSLVYSFLGIPLGILADRCRRMPILVAGITVWSLANIACGFAGSFEQLFLARAFVGIGEAALAPIAASLICDLFAPEKRSKAYGVYVAGNTVGAIIALSAVGFLLQASERLIAAHPGWLGGFAPWKLVFIVTGLPGLLTALALALVREPARMEHGGPAAGGDRRAAQTPWGTYASIVLGGMFVVAGAYAMISWYPTLLIRVHGLSPATTGMAFGLSTMTTGLVSALGSGWIIAWLSRRGRTDAPLLTGMAGGSAYLLFGALACLAPSPTTSLITTTVIAAFSNWITPSVLTALALLTHSRSLGKATAIYTMLTGIVSMSLGAYLPGLLNDTVFQTRDGIAHSLTVVYMACGALSIACFLLGRRSFMRQAART